jgi:Family of unknown function (DUF6941)
MKVEIFTLCDFASADSGGKLNIIGVFDTIWTREIPAAYALCALAIRIRFDKIEEGLKKIKISFVDSDGNPVMPTMEMQMPVHIPSSLQHGNAQVVFLIPQMKFSNFGEYSVDLAIDGRQEASTPLFVRQLPTTPQLPHFQIPGQQ